MKKIMNKNNLGTISCVTMAAMSCVGLTGCGTKAADVMEPLKDGKYEKALSNYDDADFSDKEKSKFKKQIKEHLIYVVEEYAAGNIAYEDAKNTISAISDMQISNMDENVATASGEIAALYTSKTAFENGNIYMSNADYLGAIESFNKVIEKDINYEAANEKIKEAERLHYEKLKADMLKEVDTYFEIEDYVNAFIVFDTFVENSNTVDMELNNTYKEYVNTYVEAITDKVNNFIKNKDYTSAFDEVNAAKGVLDIAEFSTLYKSIEDEYVLMITEKVEGLISSKEYLLAIDILNNAQETVTCDEFTELMNRIEEEKPIYLTDVKYQTSSRYELVSEGEEIVDTIGNTYTPNGNLYEMTYYDDGWTTDTDGKVEYYLGYSYDTFNLVIAVDEVSDNVGRSFTIYGDDVVLYTINLDRKTVPTEIKLDVSSVNYLTMKLSGTGVGTFVAILSNGYFE